MARLPAAALRHSATVVFGIAIADQEYGLCGLQATHGRYKTPRPGSDDKLPHGIYIEPQMAKICS